MLRSLLFYLLILLTSAVYAADTRVLYNQGIQLIRQQKYDEAILTLEQALENRDVPNQAPIYYFIGLAQYQKEDYEDALTTLQTDAPLASRL